MGAEMSSYEGKSWFCTPECDHTTAVAVCQCFDCFIHQLYDTTALDTHAAVSAEKQKDNTAVVEAQLPRPKRSMHGHDDNDKKRAKICTEPLMSTEDWIGDECAKAARRAAMAKRAKCIYCTDVVYGGLRNGLSFHEECHRHQEELEAVIRADAAAAMAKRPKCMYCTEEVYSDDAHPFHKECSDNQLNEELEEMERHAKAATEAGEITEMRSTEQPAERFPEPELRKCSHCRKRMTTQALESHEAACVEQRKMAAIKAGEIAEARAAERFFNPKFCSLCFKQRFVLKKGLECHEITCLPKTQLKQQPAKKAHEVAQQLAAEMAVDSPMPQWEHYASKLSKCSQCHKRVTEQALASHEASCVEQRKIAAIKAREIEEAAERFSEAKLCSHSHCKRQFVLKKGLECHENKCLAEKHEKSWLKRKLEEKAAYEANKEAYVAAHIEQIEKMAAREAKQKVAEFEKKLPKKICRCLRCRKCCEETRKKIEDYRIKVNRWIEPTIKKASGIARRKAERKFDKKRNC